MTTAVAPKLPTCRCGHTREHHMISPEYEHTFLGWFCLLFGISARPTRINYRCRRCEQVFDATTDPAVLGKNY
jgi:hypothetical protein